MNKGKKRISLAEARPDLAQQWHPTKNGELRPEDVTEKSNKLAWWLLPYDDPETGEHFDFEWKTPILSRANGAGCPYLVGNAVWPGYNDLASKRPELAKEWHPTKNRKLTPDQVPVASDRKVWWRCSKCGYVWRAAIYSRTEKGSDCPQCAKNRGKNNAEE